MAVKYKLNKEEALGPSKAKPQTHEQKILTRIADIRFEVKLLEEEEKELKEEIVDKYSPNFLGDEKTIPITLITFKGKVVEAICQKSVKTIVTTNMKKALKKLGEDLFYKVVRIDMESLRAEGGEEAVKLLKEDEKESYSIKFRNPNKKSKIS